MPVQERNTKNTFEKNIPFEISAEQMTKTFRIVAAISAGIAGLSFGLGAIAMVPILAATGYVMSDTLAKKLTEKILGNDNTSSKGNKIATIVGAAIGLSVALTVPTIGIPIALAAMFGGAYLAKEIYKFTQFDSNSQMIKSPNEKKHNVSKDILQSKHLNIAQINKSSYHAENVTPSQKPKPKPGGNISR